MVSPDLVPLRQEALKHWSDSVVIRPLEGGYRNTVLLIEQAGVLRVAKSTRRSEAAVRWAARAMQAASSAGFVVPHFIPSRAGNLVENGVTVEAYLRGDSVEQADLEDMLPLLKAFHEATRSFPQRPGFASAVDLLVETRGGDVDLSQMPNELVETCREAWQVLQGEPQSVVHGDLNPSNVLRMSDGRFALLDWDEARFDASLFDTLALSETISQKFERELFLAWEVAICWQIEPEYAREQAEKLLELT